MSPREKKLLTLFAIAGFVMANLFGFSLYNRKKLDMTARLQKAESTLQRLELFEASRDLRLDEMDWLQENLPEPAEYQNVQTALQTYCVSEATKVGLTVKDESPMSRDTLKGIHFHRVGIRFKVSGTEEALYRWLDRINMPNQLRGTTHLILSPNKEDDTKIDCTATVEQWFVPVGPTA